MKKYLVFVFFILTSYIAESQIFAVKGQTTYPFLCHLPADTALRFKPAILIVLHGRSLSGTDLNRVKRYGILNEVERGRDVPAIIVAPQLRPGESWHPDKVNEILEYIQRTYRTDTNRVYVMGMSLGGYGTLHFVGQYAHKVAAAAAFCGGGNEKDACRLATVPLWIIHGTKDAAVPFSESEKIARAISNCPNKNQMIFTVLQDAGHGAPERYFHKDEFYDWLFSKVKPSTPVPAF